MRFSKTSVREWAVGFAGLLVTFGVDLPVDQVLAYLDAIWTNGAGLALLLWSALGLWLRKITTNPVAEGVAGFFGVKR